MNSRETFYQRLRDELKSVDEQGLFKRERIIASPQDAVITLADGSEVLNFCANNYLGLSSHPDVLAAAHRTLDERGFGMSSVRFICGTQDIHRQLELRLAEFLHTEDTILYAAAFDANGGVFEPLLGEEDAIISDSLNHASIIDGVRLCKAQRYRYANNDMADLEAQLKAADAAGARTKLIVTDGVFSMDGDIAPLDKIVPLAKKYKAVVYVDDAHGSGVLGEKGKGTVHHFGFHQDPDVVQVATLSKAWAGIGGYAAGARELKDLLINKARPFLFSTSHPPAVVGALLGALELIEKEPERVERLWENTRYFKRELARLGYDTLGSQTPITPVLFGEAPLAFEASRLLLEEGVFAVGIGFPTVPRGKARIRNIVTAAHTKEMLDKALEAYEKVGKRLGIIR
jgi:glycine C-acetyltransferase